MDKNTIKEYFRSGSRPTQQHFYALIDACFNENYAIFLSGYEVKTDTGTSRFKSVTREAGETRLIPWFKRINIEQSRSYHYSIPSVNLGSHLSLNKVFLNFQLPSSGNYTAKDKTRKVEISQEIRLDYIKIYNGTEELFIMNDNPHASNEEGVIVDKAVKKWEGISVDIRVKYKLSSNIAVSDQFDITEEHSEELVHIFGGVGCEFKLRNL